MPRVSSVLVVAWTAVVRISQLRSIFLALTYRWGKPIPRVRSGSYLDTRWVVNWIAHDVCCIVFLSCEIHSWTPSDSGRKDPLAAVFISTKPRAAWTVLGFPGYWLWWVLLRTLHFLKTRLEFFSSPSNPSAEPLISLFFCLHFYVGLMSWPLQLSPCLESPVLVPRSCRPSFD